MIAVLLAAAPVFAPPEDRRLRYVVERLIDDAPPRRYRLERSVRFLHDADGVIAEVTLERTEQTPADAVSARFAAGQAPFLGRTLRIHFAADGSVAAVDGADAVFAAMIAALDPRAAAPLAALPPARRRAMVANVAEPLVAGEDAAVVPGTAAVSLASQLPGGGPVRLAGTRVVTRDPRGRLTLAIHAEGEGVVLDRTRVVDPATGLVLEDRETRTVTAAGATRTSRSIATLAPAVSEYPSANPRSR